MDSADRFDRLTRTLGQTTSRRGALKLLAGAIGGGLLLSLGVGCSQQAAPQPAPCADGATSCGDDCCAAGELCVDGSCQPDVVDACLVASLCGARHYCNEEETCICVESAEGVTLCGQLPDSCYMPLCTTSADCAYLGEGYFCDTPNSGCCSDPPAELQRCLAPCGSPSCPEAYQCDGACCAQNETCVGGWCCTPENICEDVCCDDGQECLNGVCVDPTASTEPVMVINSGPAADGLLFVSEQVSDGVYFHGAVNAGSMVVSYVALEDAYGTIDAVILDESYHPIQWMLSDVTIQVRRDPDDPTLDPAAALHIVLEEGGESTAILDIRPDRAPLTSLLDQLELEEGETFDDARAFLQNTVDTYAELLVLAQTPGEEQPRYISAAIAFSTLAAALALPGGSTAAAGVLAPAFSTGIANSLGKKVAKKMLKKVLKDAKSANKEERTGPYVYVLRCRGASAIPKLCHNAYFVYRGSSFPCLDVCHATLECFTDICMPEYMSTEKADGYRAGF